MTVGTFVVTPEKANPKTDCQIVVDTFAYQDGDEKLSFDINFVYLGENDEVKQEKTPYANQEVVPFDESFKPEHIEGSTKLKVKLVVSTWFE